MISAVETSLYPRLTLSSREAARVLGVSFCWFCRHRRKLVERHGFPPPLPGLNRYDPAALRRWQDAQLGLGAIAPYGLAPEPPLAAANDETIDWPAELERRIAALTGDLA